MKRYVVGFMFTPALDKVLLLLRAKNPYKDLYNGVGGKIEPNESTFQAMIRELFEETGIIVTPNELVPLCSIQFPNDIELNVFCGICSEGETAPLLASEEGELLWMGIDEHNLLSADNRLMAGEGNIAYFVFYGRLILKQLMAFKEASL